jgi:hypothetical protein
MRSLLTNTNTEWKPGNDVAYIENIVQCVNSGFVARDVIITLGGCLTGAGAVEGRWDDVPRGAEEVSLEWRKQNLNNPLPENFACLLSKALPQAAIIANRAQVDSGEGLKIPVLYQNGMVWHITFPDSEMKAVNGYSKTTLYPGW